MLTLRAGVTSLSDLFDRMLKGVRVRIPLGKLATHHGLSVWCIEFGIAHLTFIFEINNTTYRGMEQWSARQAHNLEVVANGSNPTSATII